MRRWSEGRGSVSSTSPSSSSSSTLIIDRLIIDAGKPAWNVRISNLPTTTSLRQYGTAEVTIAFENHLGDVHPPGPARLTLNLPPPPSFTLTLLMYGLSFPSPDSHPPPGFYAPLVIARPKSSPNPFIGARFTHYGGPLTAVFASSALTEFSF